MKHWILVITVVLLPVLVLGGLKATSLEPSNVLDKTTEKPFPKKVTSLKKSLTKPPNIKSIADSFTNLPDDDLQFIKELDKQFKVHGEKIKIKVLGGNSTLKNSKRTIDGDLGYGYYPEQQDGGYQYDKPKFIFYPYSQHDIPPSTPGYQIKDDYKSSVSIVPSYSYEVKETDEGLQPVVHQSAAPDLDTYRGAPQPANDYGQIDEPVIVLRIPGPPKYASHLQHLLQEYLEIRAVQYLKILEEADLKKQRNLAQYSLEQSPEQFPQLPEPKNPAAQNYPTVDSVYQSFKSRHQNGDFIQHLEPQVEVDQPGVLNHPPPYNLLRNVPQDPPQQPYLYMPIRSELLPPNDVSQQFYYITAPQIDYTQQPNYGAAIPNGYVDNVPISENNPRPTHTRVQFTDAANTDHSSEYPLPSIRPYDRFEVARSPIYQTYATDFQSNDLTFPDHQPLNEANEEPVVEITQKPYNYHTMRNTQSDSQTTTAPLGAYRGSAKDIHTDITGRRTSRQSTKTQKGKDSA